MRKGGPVPSHDERREAGETRVDLYIPAGASVDLDAIVDAEVAATGQPRKRCRTPAIVRAIRERAERLRKKK